MSVVPLLDINPSFGVVPLFATPEGIAAAEVFELVDLLDSVGLAKGAITAELEEDDTVDSEVDELMRLDLSVIEAVDIVRLDVDAVV